MNTKVLLIDDHPLFRKGVAQLIEADPEFELVGECGDGARGVELALALRPDVVLIDLNMKPMSGLQVLRAIKAEAMSCRCLVLTVSDDERDVLEAMRAGADGYLLKSLEPEDLCQRVKQAACGAMVLEQNVAGLLTHALNSAPAPLLGELTERESETLGLLATGRSNKEIARILGIADATVKVHIKNLLRKLNLKSRLEAAVWALNHLRGEHGIAAAPQAPAATGRPSTASDRC